MNRCAAEHLVALGLQRLEHLVDSPAAPQLGLENPAAVAAAAREGALALPADDHRRETYLQHIGEVEQRTQERFADAADLASEGLLQASRDHGLAVSAILADVPGTSGMLEAIRDGSSGLARQVEQALRAAGRDVNAAARIGVASLPTPEAALLTESIRARGMTDIEDSTRVGLIRPGLSREQIERVFAHRPTEDQAMRLQQEFIERDALPAQAAILAQSNRDLAAAPGDPLAQATAARAAAGYAELLAHFDELDRKTNLVRRAVLQLGEAGRDAVEDGLGEAIYNLLTGVGELEDALRSMAHTFVRSFSQIAANAAVSGLFGALLRGFSGPSLPMVQQGMSFSDYIAGKPFAAAKGGVIGGTWSPMASFSAPIRAFADGGIVDRPTLGLVGETGRPEAIVPLQGGAVPVSFTGGGHGMGDFRFDPTIIVVNSAAEAAIQAMASPAGQSLIIDSVSGDVLRGGRSSRAIRMKMGR